MSPYNGRKSFWYREDAMYISVVCGGCGGTIKPGNERRVGVIPIMKGPTEPFTYRQEVRCGICWLAISGLEFVADVSDKPQSIVMVKNMQTELNKVNENSPAWLGASPEERVHVSEAEERDATTLVEKDGVSDVPTPLPDADSFADKQPVDWSGYC